MLSSEGYSWADEVQYSGLPELVIHMILAYGWQQEGFDAADLVGYWFH